MSVKWTEQNPGASIADIRDVAPAAPATDHADWIEFLRRNDGATPEPNAHEADPDVAVHAFYSAAEARVAHRDLSDRMPPHLLPIADAEGGNFVCLGLGPDASGVLFWDHETEEARPVAASFARFLEQLSPFGPDSVELAPGQVISAWIDPALLEAERKKR